MKRKPSFFTDWNFKELLTVEIVIASVFSVLFILILRLDDKILRLDDKISRLDDKIDSVRQGSNSNYQKMDDRLYTISNQLNEMNGKLQILIDKKR